MKKKYLIIPAAVIVVAITMAFAFAGKSSKTPNAETGIEKAPVELTTSVVAEDFKWYTVNEALELNKTTGKKIFIDTYTNWCGPCKMLEANTFSNPTIRKLLTEYFIPTKFNAEGADTILYNGKTFVNAKYSAQPRMSTHPFAIEIASTQNGLGYPTMVFLAGDLKKIDALAGYLQPSQLEPILVYYGSEVNKTTDWPTFLSTFKSEITQ